MKQDLKNKKSGTAPVKGKHGSAGYEKYYWTGILLLIVLVYSNSLKNEMVNFDDNEYFANYPEITHLSFRSILVFFSSYYVIMYQPIPVLTFAINYFFTGMNSFPYHVVNLTFHLANTILVFGLVRSLTENKNTAFIVALLFGIHPMNVEAVSWISARSSVLYTCFYLLALRYYITYIRKGFQTKYLIYCGLFFLLSIFSKTQAVTLPVVLMLLDYYFGRKLFSMKVLTEKIPFFIVSLVLGIITLMNKETLTNITAGMMISYTPPDIFFMVCYSFVYYLFMLVMPFHLCSVHVFPPKTDGLLPLEYYAAPLFLFMFIYFIYRNRRNKYLVFSAGLFLATISINIQLIPSRLFIVCERYGYFPYIGLFLFLFGLIEYVKKNKNEFYSRNSYWLAILFVFYILFFSVTTYNRNAVWKSDLELMSDILDKNPRVPYLYRAYGTRGNFLKAQNRMPEAISDFSEAIKLKPDDARTYVNRAYAFIQANSNKEALSDLNSAVKQEPKNILFISTRAMVYVNMNNLDAAFADCNEVIALDSTYSDIYNTRASIDFTKKEYETCEQDVNKAIRFNPKFADAYKNRGLLYITTNRRELACKDWDKAMELGSKDAYIQWQNYCK